MNFVEEKIIFQKTRDIGEVISTTFRIIRENYRVLLLGALYFVVPFYLLGTVFFSVSFNAILLASSTPDGVHSASGAGLSVLFMFLGVCFLALGFIMQITYVNELIKYLARNPDLPRPGITEIWKATRKFFGKNILHAIVWFIVTSIGGFAAQLLSFVLLPFLLLGSAMGGAVMLIIFSIVTLAFTFLLTSYVFSISMPIFFISTYENTNIFNAIGRSLSLMHLRRENFWGAVFANAAAFLICIILATNIFLPLSLITAFISFNSGEADPLNNNETIRVIMQVGTAIFTLLQSLTLIIPLITLAVKYFDWTERIDARGLIHRISTIGHNKDFDPRSYEESY